MSMQWNLPGCLLITYVPGIIGKYLQFKTSVTAHFMEIPGSRSSICCQSSRLRDRPNSTRRAMWHDRLDNSSHRYQCQTQRQKLVYRDHEQLLWIQWTCSCVLFSVLVCIRRCVIGIVYPQ